LKLKQVPTIVLEALASTLQLFQSQDWYWPISDQNQGQYLGLDCSSHMIQSHYKFWRDWATILIPRYWMGAW
jgi:hypothetical protein